MRITDTYRKIWWILDKRSRRNLLFTIPIPVIGSLIELAAAVLIFNLIIFVVGSPVRAPSMEVFEKYAWLAWIRDQGVTFAVIAVAITAIFKGGYRLVALYLQSLVVERSIRMAKSRLYTSYLSAPLLFYASQNKAGLIRNLWTQVETVIRSATDSAHRILTSTFTIAALAFPIVMVSPKSLLIVLLFIAVLSGIVLSAARKYQLRWGRSWHSVIAEMLAIVQQSFDGIREIKVYQRESFFLNRYESDEVRFERLRRWQKLIDTAPGIVLEASMMVGLCVVLLWLYARGMILASMGPVLGLIAYSSLRILPLSNDIIKAISSFHRHTSAVASVYDDLQMLQEDVDYRSAFGQKHASDTESVSVTSRVSDIRLESVSFTYPSERTAGIRNISMSIPRGQAVAIVGPTGAGKSTFLNLLLGFLPPEQGRILVDGVDIRQNPGGWLSRIGYVPQDPYMLDGSIKENIAFAIEEDRCDIEAVKAAVTAAQLDGWVQSLPRGLDTQIGERGVQISGGQRQRIAIARALYVQPTILIMDEPTSAIDARTERALERAILDVQGNMTRIIVTHRLETAKQCDNIVFMENGAVEGIGSFSHLEESLSSFRSFVSSIEQTTHIQIG